MVILIDGNEFKTRLLMEEETKKHELSKIQLRVFKDNRARILYEKLGYKQIELEETSIVLEKRV